MNIFNISPSPGIYYEHFGSKLNLILINFNKIKELCLQNKLPSLISCNYSISILAKDIHKITNQNSLLKELVNDESFVNNRKKRVFINGLGNIIKAITGNLDNDDAKYYNDAIEELNSNENHLNNLLKEQIQIVRSTIQNFNRSISNVEKNDNN